MEIVKVQVPIIGPKEDCLVYDKAQKHMTIQSLDKATKAALKGDLKGYFKATWSSKRWAISHRVGDMDW